MERAPLHPVPSRPYGPIAPAEAVRYVAGELPGLDDGAAAAFALVALVGRPRPEVGGPSDVAGADGLAGEALAEALTRARKALRRKLHPLPGSGWCERAERLISDRLDDALEDPGPARLEVHLANCGRCVEHERRLGQAQDALVAGFAQAHPGDEPEPERPSPAPEPPSLLRAVEAPALPAPSSPRAPSTAPTPAPWTTAPVASFNPAATMPGAELWRSEPARRLLGARATEGTWASIGGLVVAIAVLFMLAGLLTRRR